MKTRNNKLLVIVCTIFIFTANTFAQQIQVTGIVTDAQTRELIVGATVTEKGSKKGTVTDTKGRYSITTQHGKKLVISFIGYEKKEVVVKSEYIDVALTPDQKALEEVVVVGYASQRMISTVGAISVADVADVKVSNYNQPSSFMPVMIKRVQPDAEEYGSYKENRFLSAKEQALSTFSLDVDAASYGNMRRMINMGQKPPKDAIRVEELINYFSYDYPKPTGKDPVSINTETSICPWDATHRLVKIGVKAREIPSENLPASNFVFLLDVSGSMDVPNKLELVKSSIKLLTNNLRKTDRVAIVVYAGAAGVVLESTEGTDKQKIMEAVDGLHAGGSTAGGAGIQLAYKIAEKNFIENGNNRIVLCTDGDFNVGVSSNNELESLIESKRKTGVYLTVLGYGMGNYKDNKLQILAEKGNGNHAYIDNIQEANKVLVNEFGSTMYTVAKDVKIQVEFNPAQVNAYRLIGYESRLLNKEDFNDDTKDAGELGSGHTVTALYEIIPAGVKNTYGGVDNLKYQTNNNTTNNVQPNNSSELLTVKLRYKFPNSDSSNKMEVPVLMSDINKKPSSDFKFIMAVSMFGQLLRESDFKGNSSYDKVIELANNGIGNDTHGYRREFVRLVESVNQLDK
ncbi:von Willebrand factor type A [Paludibacter propionicigenes WB4]|uniref:von Willebrand factor type A n=1 Tax=Paludibacter propionicigenes (strain DSM 17365 / JCM 13257 / WB4) TaxID=694427 RepID=E4T6T0_PALPW|nr:VWA domain-containing protein [Paludibacter propionicigenes]ADQ80424.1 von Willebrand factor type A [Paludibacter propionicigenes WB4]